MSELSLPFHSRKHFKHLFGAIGVQIILAVLHVLVAAFWQWDYQWVAHLIIVGFEIWYVLIPVLRWWNEVYTVTDEVVRCDWGVLNKQAREIDLTRIASISEERDLFDRIFGCGTLNFYDAAAEAQPNTLGSWNDKRGAAKSGVRFNDVPNVKKVKELVETARRRKRGL